MSDPESEPAGRETPEQTYEQAVDRLDEIIARLDSGDAELRETLDLCTEARGLIEFCAGELAAVDEGLKELRLEDLAASLTGTSTEVSGEPAPPAGESASAAAGASPPLDDGDVPF